MYAEIGIYNLCLIRLEFDLTSRIKLYDSMYFIFELKKAGAEILSYIEVYDDA